MFSVICNIKYINPLLKLSDNSCIIIRFWLYNYLCNEFIINYIVNSVIKLQTFSQVFRERTKKGANFQGKFLGGEPMRTLLPN